MATAATLRSLVAALALATALAAQARAPFSGTVRDLGGAPIGNAVVTCAWTPDFSAVGVPDRVTATTDAEGRFRMDLVVGNAYAVWAIGPPDSRGACPIVRPSAAAAGGKKLDLIATERRGPMLVQVSGTAGWINDGPLALRATVDGLSMGPEVLIPGDGPFRLPPLPSAQVDVTLVGGDGQFIESIALDLDADPALSFAPPREVAVVAEDETGMPLAGVKVLRRVHTGPFRLGPIPGSGGAIETSYELATTGDDGTAVVRCTSRGNSAWFFGRLPGHGDSISGWLRGKRIVDGQEVADEDPLRFVLRPAVTTKLRVRGLADGERAAVVFRGAFPFRLRNGRGALSVLVPATAADDGVFTTKSPAPAAGVAARVHVLSDDPVPQRVVAVAYAKHARLPDFDLAPLREVSLEVVDAAGRAVPCAHVGVTFDTGGGGHPVHWTERFVTDARGRAELRLGPHYDWDVYATTGAAHAVHVLHKDDPADSIRLVLEPLPTARFVIVDERGRPVRGARLVSTGGSFHSPSEDDAGKALDRIAFGLGPANLRQPRSNAAGELTVFVPFRKGAGFNCKAHAGKRVSERVQLHSDGEVRQVVVK